MRPFPPMGCYFFTLLHYLKLLTRVNAPLFVNTPLTWYVPCVQVGRYGRAEAPVRADVRA